MSLRTPTGSVNGLRASKLHFPKIFTRPVNSKFSAISHKNSARHYRRGPDGQVANIVARVWGWKRGKKKKKKRKEIKRAKKKREKKKKQCTCYRTTACAECRSTYPLPGLVSVLSSIDRQSREVFKCNKDKPARERRISQVL